MEERRKAPPSTHPFAMRPDVAEQLLHNVPPRPQAMSEVLFLVALVFAPGLLGRGGLWSLGFGVALLASVAVWLLRPVRLFRSRRLATSLSAMLLLALALALALAEPVFGPSSQRHPVRLGVSFAQQEQGRLVLTHVAEATPAHGRLEKGDVVLEVENTPLPELDPARAFRTRIESAGGGEATTMSFLVERDGERRLVEVSLLPARKGPLARFGSGLTWLSLRAAGVILLVALFVWRAGQGLAQLGLFWKGLGKDLLWAFPMLVVLYGLLVTISIPLAVLAKVFGLQQGELEARRDVAAALVGTGLSVPEFFATMLLVASFEEIAFRGFMLPRLRTVLGSWRWGLVLMAVLFGVGHLYEGPLAVFQTAALGAFFGIALLYRGRLAPVMLAHALFNTVSYAAMTYLSRTGLLEKLPKMVGE